MVNLYSSYYCSSVSPSPSTFVSAVRIEWLLQRWACKGQSNYCVWTALLSSVVLVSPQFAACIVQKQGSFVYPAQTENVSRTILTCDRTIMNHYWWPPKIFFQVICFFSSQSWIIGLRLLKCINDSEIDVLVDISIDITVMSLQPIKKILKQDSPRWAFKKKKKKNVFFVVTDASSTFSVSLGWADEMGPPGNSIYVCPWSSR